MDRLIQTLHPSLRLNRHPALAGSGGRLFSRQGSWDAGSALHCAAMALAMLGKLPDPVDVRRHARGPAAQFWHRAWPHYLHGLSLTELASFIWELDFGVYPVLINGTEEELPRLCERELAEGWPVILAINHARTAERHMVLVVGIEARRTTAHPVPTALLLLDPAEPEPVLAHANARLDLTARHPRYITARAQDQVVMEGAIAIRRTQRAATEADCA